MTDTNLIPEIHAAGRFEAIEPFNKVVDVDTYYTVEAIRTVQEMEGLKLNLYEILFKPIGVSEDDFVTVLSRAKAAGHVVVTLLDRHGKRSNVLSGYFKSFPMKDGVSYERMCLIVDLGAIPPSMNAVLLETQKNIQDLVEDTVGIKSNVRLGTVPTPSYVSREQYEAFERTRKETIKNNDSSVARIRELETALVKKDAYIQRLEQMIKKP